jgi:hypothetical protein
MNLQESYFIKENVNIVVCLGYHQLFWQFLSFEIHKHLTALFYVKNFASFIKVVRCVYFKILRLIFAPAAAGTVHMASSFWNRHLTCIAVERFSTNCRQLAK